jgi:hypothetical protein
MKKPWTSRLDIAVRRTVQKRSARSEKSFRLIRGEADGSSPERFADDGIGLNPTAFSRI